MIKKMILALAAVAGVMVAQADFLWWQVAPDSGKTFSSAQLYASANGTDTALGEALFAVDLDLDTMKGSTIETTSTDITGYTGEQYSYFVELVTYTADGESVASTDRMNPVSYTDLLSGGYITTPGVGLPLGPSPSLGGVNLGGTGSAVPEPTSGMLFVLGGALMALRRRRRA